MYSSWVTHVKYNQASCIESKVILRIHTHEQTKH